MPYTRRNGDKAWRRVDLNKTQIPVFEEFQSAGQVITFAERKQVVELLHEDGSTELYTGNFAVQTVYYRVAEGNQIWLSCPDNPAVLPTVTARIWLKKKGADAVSYKVPLGLPVQGGECGFRVAAGANELELYGDEYFNALFQLVQR